MPSLGKADVNNTTLTGLSILENRMDARRLRKELRENRERLFHHVIFKVDFRRLVVGGAFQARNGPHVWDTKRAFNILRSHESIVEQFQDECRQGACGHAESKGKQKAHILLGELGDVGTFARERTLASDCWALSSVDVCLARARRLS